MDDKTLTALQVLAQNLGTTAEYLWGVLIKQAPITGAIDLTITVALVISVWVWAKFTWSKTTNSGDWESDDPASILNWIGVAVSGLIAFSMLCHLSITVAALVNPEYWALMQVFKK